MHDAACEGGRAGQPCKLAILADRVPAGQALALAARNNLIGLGLHLRADREPCLDSPQILRAQRVGRGKSVLQPDNVYLTAFNVHLIEPQGAGLRHSQAMPEHEKQKAPVAGLVGAPLGGLNELFDFPLGKMFSVFVHFVQFEG